MSEKVLKTWKLLEEGKSHEVRYHGITLHCAVTDTEVCFNYKPLKFRKNPWNLDYTEVTECGARYDLYWSGSVDSCAYQRFHPTLHPHKDAKVWLEYYLEGMDYVDPIIAYLIPRDGRISDILPVLVRAGFNQVAVTKSQEGEYPVYMLVHPGTKAPLKKWYKYTEKKNKNNDDEAALESMDSSAARVLEAPRRANRAAR